MTERLAIIKEVGIGMRDCPVPVLWFTTYIDESGAALQVLTWDQAYDLIRKYGLYEIHNLKGKPCYVEVDDKERKIVYSRPCLI